MKQKFLFGFLIFILIATTLLSACSDTQTTSATTSTSSQRIISTTTSVTSSTSSTTTQSVTTSTSATQANWWDKFSEPKYGGDIVIPYAGMADINFDNYSLVGSDYMFWLESPFSKINWTVDREKWSYLTDFTPEQYAVGSLAESWERPDSLSLIIHLRQGIHWQNKAPVNGREFTAYDVQAHYNRLLGTGDGYTTPAPTWLGTHNSWGKVVAVDKYTVKLIFTQATGSTGLLSIMETMGFNCIEAPEWVALGGTPGTGSTTTTTGVSPLQDWHNVVGTGPWMVSDFTRGSSLTYSKNPDYWGYDERYPENRVPYADTLTVLMIPDTSTKLAALRTAKIDTLSNITQDQFKSLAVSNPEIQYVKFPGGAEGVCVRVDKEPFDDIRVRTAMQMSVDLNAIAKKLEVDATPVGFVSPLLKGCYYPYEEWSQQLKDEFTYNLTGARQLLTEAGYPNGFKTNVVTSGTNTDMLQIMKAYFLDIGIDMEIKVMDGMALRAFLAAGKHDQMAYGGGAFAQAPTSTLSRFDSKNVSLNNAFVNDPNYDAIVKELYEVTTAEGVADVMKKADKYITERHWYVISVPSNSYIVWQPYLKGYSGEVQVRYSQGGWLFARLWVDE